MSPGATGKSWLALEVATAVAGGPDILDLGINRYGRVMLIAAEDPELILRHRMHALGERLSKHNIETVIENLDVPLALAQGVNLRNQQWIDQLAHEGEGCRLIIIDTLSRVHDGDENDRKDAAPIMRSLEILAAHTGAAILFLHHISKGMALAGQGDQQQAARGSSVWVDESRWAGFLRGMDATEGKALGVGEEMRRHFVRFGVNKCNYGAPFLDIWLRKETAGLLTRAVLEKSRRPKAKKGVGDDTW